MSICIQRNCSHVRQRQSDGSANGIFWNTHDLLDNVTSLKSWWCIRLFVTRQVRWDDQSQYHQESESVFVGGRLSFLLTPPAVFVSGLFGTEDDTHNRPSRRGVPLLPFIHGWHVVVSRFMLIASVVCHCCRSPAAGMYGCAVAASLHDC